MSSNWYVICGGPSSGKTTLLRELEKRGFKTRGDVARVVLEREVAKGRSPNEVRKNEVEFQREVTRIKLEKDKALPKNVTTFFDTGLPDGIAYMIASGNLGSIDEVEAASLEITEARDALQTVRDVGYRKVFILEQLPILYDGVRTEDNEHARKIGEALRQVYEFLGCEIVDVPALPVEDRVKFILSHVENYQKKS